jgi:hypothetical protein
VGIAPCRTTYHAALRINDANTHKPRVMLGEIGSISASVSVLPKVPFLTFIVYEFLLMRNFRFVSEEIFVLLSRR